MPPIRCGFCEGDEHEAAACNFRMRQQEPPSGTSRAGATDLSAFEIQDVDIERPRTPPGSNDTPAGLPFDALG